MTKEQDTIFALSSTPGRSALSIIRISGKLAFSTVEKITKMAIQIIEA